MKSTRLLAAAMALSLTAAPAAMAQIKQYTGPKAGPTAGPSAGPSIGPSFGPDVSLFASPAGTPGYAALASLLALTGLLGAGVIAARKRTA